MAQKFAQDESLVSDAIEEQYGEQIRVEPRGDDGEFQAKTADPNRPAATIVAIVDFEPKTMKSRYGGRNDADTADLAGEKLHVSIRETLLPYVLKSGDLILLLERSAPYPTRAVIATVEPDGIGRYVCRCKPGARP